MRNAVAIKMEPSDNWRTMFLIFGVALPAFAVTADVVWFSANVVVVLASVAWFGFFMLFTEGVKD